MKNAPLKGRGLGHVTLLKILEPVFIFGTVKRRNFLFGTYIDPHEKLPLA